MRHLRSVLAVVSVVLFAAKLFGQSPEIMPRINGPVDESALVVVQGSLSSIARPEFDRGPAPPSTQLTHVRLVLARSDAQQADLDKYDADLLDKSSPNYHKWLTPQQYGKLYGPADSDIAAIVAWLETHGLQVDPADPARTNVAFSGSVAQLEQALHTSIHSFEINGEQFYSNTTNPSIPAAIASVVSGVARLNTLKPKPQHVQGRMGLFDPSAGKFHPAPSDATQGVRPDLTTGSGTGADPYILYIVPGDAATMYDTPNTVLNANYTTGTSYTGTGVTIGIGGDAPILAGTVAAYRQRFLGDSKQPTITNIDGPTDSTNQDEAYIDTELAGGLAPGANIHFYTATKLDVAIEQMLADNSVDIFSLSFGACELDMTTSYNVLVNGWWQQAATQGIAVTVSSGDNGSAGCDYQPSTGAGVANAGLKVSGFASTPYNIAVGGTDLVGIASQSNFPTYVSATSASGTFYRTALSYIPESTWNDSISVDTTISANIPYVDSKGNTNIVAGSGGKSSCTVNSTTYDSQNNETRGTCTSGYPKPSWQRGPGVPADSARDLPDVSLMSGAGGDFAAWLVCTDTKGTVGGVSVIANCTTQSDNQFYFFGFGGTSTAAPAFAGILALVQQKTGARLGQAAKELYDLYNSANAGAVFHDITVGNISVPCANGSPDCQQNGAGHLFLSNYDTTPGYDLATGIGSVDAKQLVTFWGTATGGSTVTVTLAPASTTITRGSALSVPVTVKGSATTGNPTGKVTLSGGGYTPAAQTLTASGTDSATYTFNIPANSLNVGADTLSVTYSGDSNYASATGTASVNVISQGNFSLSATNLTVTAGATSANVSTVTVTPTGGFTGSVTLTAAVTSSPAGAVSAPTLTVAGSPVTITGATPGTATVAVSTTSAAAVRAARNDGADWFRAAGGSALAALLLFCIPLGSRRNRRMLSLMLIVVAAAFTAVGCGGGSTTTPPPTKTTPSVTVSPSASTLSAADAITVAVTLSGGTSTPTGTVSLSGGGFSSSATTLASGAATVSIPANSFTSTGSVTLTASYSGDSNFNAASGTATLTVKPPKTTAGPYTVTVTGKDAAANITQTTTFTLTVN